MKNSHEPASHYRYVVVAAVFLIMAVIWGFYATFGVFFGPLIENFGWTRAFTSGASSVRELIFGVALIFTARMADRFSPRIVVSITALLFGAGYFLMSRVQTAWQFYLFFGIIISCGMSGYIAMLSIVAQWFERRRGLMTAVCFSGMGIGSMVMPPIAAVLIASRGWRTSYAILAVLGFILMIITAQFIMPFKRQLHDPAPAREKGPTGAALSLSRALCTGAFWQLAALYFFFLYVMVSMMVHVVMYATGSGISSVSAANILAIMGGMGVVGMNVSGFAADRISNRRTLGICFFLMTISVILLMTAGSTGAFYLFAVLFGLSYGGIQILFSPLVAELFGLGSHGVILSSAAFLGSIGATLGPFVTGYIFDLADSYLWAFRICFLMAAAGMILALRLRSCRKPVSA